MNVGRYSYFMSGLRKLHVMLTEIRVGIYIFLTAGTWESGIGMLNLNRWRDTHELTQFKKHLI